MTNFLSVLEADAEKIIDTALPAANNVRPLFVALVNRLESLAAGEIQNLIDPLPHTPDVNPGEAAVTPAAPAPVEAAAPAPAAAQSGAPVGAPVSEAAPAPAADVPAPSAGAPNASESAGTGQANGGAVESSIVTDEAAPAAPPSPAPIAATAPAADVLTADPETLTPEQVASLQRDLADAQRVVGELQPAALAQAAGGAPAQAPVVSTSTDSAAPAA